MLETSEKSVPLSLEKWFSEPGQSVPEGTHLTGLNELGKSLFLAELMRREDRPLTVVFPTRTEARNAIDNLKFFLEEADHARIQFLNAVDFDYYRGLLPNPESLCERNVALFHLLNNPRKKLFVTTVGAVLQKVVPSMEFLRASRVLAVDEDIDREVLIQNLLEAGYQRQPTAFDPGVFAVRGGVLDVFCPLYANPLRAEFFGDTIEELRFFDEKTQRSLEKVERVSIVPVGQTLIPHGNDLKEAALRIKERLDSLGVPKNRRDELIDKLQTGAMASEYAHLFPLLSKGSATIFEYFPKDMLVIWDRKSALLEAAREVELPKFHQSIELYEKEPAPIAPRESLFVTASEFSDLIQNPQSLVFEDFASGKHAEMSMACEPIALGSSRDSAVKSSSLNLLEGFAKKFRDWMDQGYRIHIVSHTQTHSGRMSLLFEPYGLHSRVEDEGSETRIARLLGADFAKLHLWQGYLTKSGAFPNLRLVLLSEEEIFGHKKRAPKSSNWSATGDPGRLLSSFRDLKVNDFIVHRDHGIGRYLGLKSMNFLDVPNDYVLLEYKDGDKLYIPVYRLNVLQKYLGGEEGNVVMDKLGGDRWVKAKGKAQRAIAELAAEFLNLHAKRKLLPAHPFSAPGPEYHQFEMEFPFDETPDQMKAIEEVMHDLGQAHPMDRLVCGDVGYGKTEVAMRAAYRAVLDKKQVAVLVPTTVLAFQHFQSFLGRFKNTGARVEMVSRLRTSAQIKKTLESVKEGKIDILVGTHRLLSSDVEFKDLGLIVIDEEHRFGVLHKEKLKKMAESLHMVSMTATPIPRTLNMAMSGIKEVSIITTPPPDRLSIRTFVCRNAPEVIAEAVSNELARGGQVFFVHNRVQSILGVADDLKKLLPKVRIEVVHGQMDPETLEKKMLSFYQGEFDILLTTAIIESGIDIPKANTILIDDAQNFGLAQLYQLRGRVGRSDKRAYAYLLVPAENQRTDEGKQRLQVIQRYTELGSGFSIASHDLEIRGAGDLLGEDQSGHLHAIGVELYFELLEESIRALRGEIKKSEIEPEINLRIPAHFPADYLPDISERVVIYRRLSSVDSEEGISLIEEEIRDRFGTLPEEVVNLLGIMTMKLHLKRLHVVRMSVGPKKTSLQFAPTTPASPERLVKLIQRDPKRYALTPDQKLVFAVEDPDWRAQLKEIQRLSEILGVP
jgi:transcription-repair coupling factor (superfamily II helicase)